MCAARANSGAPHSCGERGGGWRGGGGLDLIRERRNIGEGQICLELSECYNRNNTITSPQSPVILLKGSMCACAELG